MSTRKFQEGDWVKATAEFKSNLVPDHKLYNNDRIYQIKSIKGSNSHPILIFKEFDCEWYEFPFEFVVEIPNITPLERNDMNELLSI